MKSYLEIYVPLDSHHTWFTNLKEVLRSVHVRWQNGFYHITIAFIDDLPENVDVVSIIDEHFRDASSFHITLDSVDAFTASNGMHMICLKPNNIPNTFIEKAIKVRRAIINAGGIISTELVPHVTLGRVNGKSMNLSDIKGLLSTLHAPSFSMSLSHIDYRAFRGDALYEKLLTETFL